MLNKADVTFVMAVYHMEKPSNLELAIKSMLTQTVKASRIIIVKDGPLGEELDSVIESFTDESISIYGFEVNRGVAEAWNFGVRMSDTKYIARMDSDDVSHPQRLEFQLDYLKHNDIDVLGGFIQEFTVNDTMLEADNPVRVVPLTHEEIKRSLDKRNPMNHVTVIFKKSAWEKVNGYQMIKNHVDWWFWARMLNSDVKFNNMDKMLVYVRKDPDQIQRRGGIAYLRTEIVFNNAMLKSKYLTLSRAIMNVIIRMPFRLMPVKLRMIAYSLLR